MSDGTPTQRARVARTPPTGATGSAPVQCAALQGPDRHSFHVVCLLATLVGVLVLGVLLFDIVSLGAGRLSWEFLNGFPSRFARGRHEAGAHGLLWTLVLTAVIAFPLGVGTAIWLEEYAPASRLKRIIETNIANLAGVPSIVYGMLGLAVFVRYLASAAASWRRAHAGAADPAGHHHRIAGGDQGGAELDTTGRVRARRHALGDHPLPRLPAGAAGHPDGHHPGPVPGHRRGRAAHRGRRARVRAVRAPQPLDPFTVMPIQIYNWVSRPQAEFHELAAAASIVLLVLLLSMNAWRSAAEPLSGRPPPNSMHDQRPSRRPPRADRGRRTGDRDLSVLYGRRAPP
jgi:phosphate transport system permease protein